ncbi:MAG: hypothetical protein ABW080_20150 [Candidatus Thiodiazotropha sp.]
MGELKSCHLSDQDLAKLEIEARELSSYASTSIEGNPLPLTDVKRLLKRRKEHGTLTQREYGGISTRSLASRKLDFVKLVKMGLIESKGTGRGTYYMRVS